MKKLYLTMAASLAACICTAATPRSFAAEVEHYLAAHRVAGMETYADFCRLVAQPAAESAVDATVQPCHKARKIRFWGALEHLPLFKSWGLDAAEFDPEAAAHGDYPDVIFCHLDPGYSQGAVDQILDAVRHGTHFVTLQSTDRWCETMARRLGHTYGGVLNVPAKGRGGVFFKNCPKLFAGFPEGRLDEPTFSFFSGRCGMFMTGEKCLLGAADVHGCRIASAIAQYEYGKGAMTFVGPFVNQNSAKDMNARGYKRLLLNLVDLLPPVAREKPYDVLLYTRWKWHRDPKTGAVGPARSFHHFSTEVGAGDMARYFEAKGLRVKVTDDPDVFLTPAFRACPRMVFACANEEQFETESQRSAFYDWAKSGGGTLVLHSASNCEIGSARWREFLGGTFLFHYPRQMPVPFAGVADRSSPAIACLPAGYVWPREEIYVNDIVPGAVKPVLKFDARAVPADMQKWIKDRGRAPADGFHVLEWTKDYGKGRVYYSALGHNPSDFSRPEFLEHLYQACLWTAPLSAAVR